MLMLLLVRELLLCIIHVIKKINYLYLFILLSKLFLSVNGDVSIVFFFVLFLVNTNLSSFSSLSLSPT